MTATIRDAVGSALPQLVILGVGLLVMPGQVVSFNEVVGPRSSETGYKIAPVIINDEFVDDIGGGVVDKTPTDTVTGTVNIMCLLDCAVWQVWA